MLRISYVNWLRIIHKGRSMLIECVDIFVHSKLAQRVNLIKSNNKHEKVGG